MEVGTEISQKIRSAIKAKLMEIGSYVDDELPDYIMVMVANKKTKQQMVNDLSLFLGSNTDVFTTWLHGLLVKLQTLSTDANTNSEQSKSLKEKKKEKKSKDGTGAESKKGKGKVSKLDGDGDVPKAKSARTSSVDDKNNTNTCHNKDPAASESDKVKSNLNSSTNSKNAEALDLKQREESTSDDVEDVRQLLVTESPADELAKELENTEAGIERLAPQNSSTKSKASTSTRSIVKMKDTLDSNDSDKNISSREIAVELAPSSKKRKCPSSVVAAVRRSDSREGELSTPVIASVVKVTARKSNFPQSMQANRALLMKAMGEAERSISIKRKIAIAKPISREDSPSEIYTPKRRKSETSGTNVSPPPYIPSRKEPSISSRSRGSDKDGEQSVSARPDARRLLERRELSRTSLPSRERRELVSRSRRIELLEKLGLDSKETSNDRDKRMRDREEELTKRVNAKDKLNVVRNFKITAHVAPSSRLSEIAKERLVKALSSETAREKLVKVLEDNERSLQVTVRPSISSSRGSLASRLGKVVVQQRSGSDKNEIASRLGKVVVQRGSESDKNEVASRLGKVVVQRRSESEKEDTDVKNKSKVTISSKGQRLGLSLLAKEVVNRQCEAAVLSVKSNTTHRYEKVEAHDSRVVENHSSSEEEEAEDQPPVAVVITRKERVKSETRDDSAEEKEYEDLDEMLKDSEMDDELNDTLTDEFTLDLEDDEDLIKVVGQLEDEVALKGKPEANTLGTRFIVTLDGVDERQFEGSREHDYRPSNYDITSQQLSLPGYHSVPSTTPSLISNSLDQATFLLPQDPTKSYPILKPAPPKIQPFSISLKDSDDEFEDKADPKSLSAVTGYGHPPQPTVSHNALVPQQAEGLTTLQKAKLSERCKFWPACVAGSECEFHHPTTHCKTFPNCKFGDKCLFIHPNCKFDSKCARNDCPFTHTSRRPALGGPSQPFSSQVTAAVPKQQSYYPPYIPFSSSTTQSSSVCKFYPNCNNVNCLFIHPKPCRFGLACQSVACPFFHPSAPTKDKLKWTAAHQTVAEHQVKEGTTTPSLHAHPSSIKPKPPPSSSTCLAGVAAVSSTSV